MRYALAGMMILAVLGSSLSAYNAPLPPRNPDPSFAEIPTTLEQFLEIRERLAYTPEGGAAMFILSMMIFTQNEKLGRDCLTITMDNSQLIKSTGGYKGYEPAPGFSYSLTRLRDMPWIPFSYIEGTDPSQAYSLPQGMYTLRFSGNPFVQTGENTVRVFVDTTGDGEPRPVIVKRNDKGIWKVYEYTYLFYGVTQPARIKSDNL